MDKKIIDTVAVSSRIRLARNVAGLPFPSKLQDARAGKITDSVGSAIEQVGNFHRYDMNKTDKIDAGIMKEKHLISADLVDDCPYGSVFIGEDETVSVMVNEEDHIREQVILSGMSLEEAYQKAESIDDALAKSIEFAYSDKLGYLTACATNIGTGLRSSVMLFLPALTLTKSMQACVNNLSRLDMTVRGAYGENSNGEGFMYQVSNQRTLGVSESEIIKATESAAAQVVELECRAREGLKNDETLLKDKILRAYGTASNAYTLSASEAAELTGLIKLGVYYGYFKEKADGLNRLITDVQHSFMRKLNGSDIGVDVLRARYVNQSLKDVVERLI